MKLTNQQVLNGSRALVACSRWVPNAKAMMHLARNLRKLQEASGDFDVARNAVLEKNGAVKDGQGWKTEQPVENGPMFIVFDTDEGQLEADVELQALLETEVEVDIRVAEVTEKDLEKDGIDIGRLSELVEWMVVLKD